MTRKIDRLSKLRPTNAFINASLIYIVANGIGQGTTLLVNTFFTRHMSQSDYGLYSNYYSLVAMLGPIVGANLYDGLANAYMDYKEKIHDFRSSVLLLSLIWGSTISCVTIWVFGVVSWSIPLIGVVLSLIHAYGFFAINYYLQSMNMENRFIRKGIGLCVPNILQALFGVIAVILCNNYISRAAGSAVGVALCGAIGVFLICRDTRPRYNAEYWKYALRISLPAIISSIAAMIMQQSDKAIITELINSETTAIYALIYNIGYILYAVQQATNGVWQVWYYNTLENKNYERVPFVQKWYLFVMLILATGLYMIAPEAVKILSPSSYWQFEYVVPFIIGSYFMLMHSICLSTLHYYKKNGVASWIVSAAAVMNVMLNYLLIPHFGGIAAAYTTVIAYLFIYAVTSVYLVAKKQYYFRGKYFLLFSAGVILMGMIFYIVMDQIWIRYGVFIILLLIEALYLYIKRKTLKNILN
ncbi:MAG: oligosaccharide flippase family protein [Clostridium sp.]|nr:oligosaccharide flippase family protein [Clostridium sp.]